MKIKDIDYIDFLLDLDELVDKPFFDDEEIERTDKKWNSLEACKQLTYLFPETEKIYNENINNNNGIINPSTFFDVAFNNRFIEDIHRYKDSRCATLEDGYRIAYYFRYLEDLFKNGNLIVGESMVEDILKKICLDPYIYFEIEKYVSKEFADFINEVTFVPEMSLSY